MVSEKSICLMTEYECNVNVLTVQWSECIWQCLRLCCSSLWRTWWLSEARWSCGLPRAARSRWVGTGIGRSAPWLVSSALGDSPWCDAWAVGSGCEPGSMSRSVRQVTGNDAAGMPVRPYRSRRGSSGCSNHVGSWQNNRCIVMYFKATVFFKIKVFYTFVTD